MRPRFLDLWMHLARLSLSAVVLAIAARAGEPALAAAASAALFFAAFAWMHDLAHGALRLPRWINEIALSLAGALMLMSGHALRLMHLRHHARPLAKDDVEGAPARLSLAQAIASAPRAALSLRISAFHAARARGRAWQAAEISLNAAAFALLIASGSPSLIAWASVAAALQLSMSVWAAHIPHNAPEWLLDAARALAFSRSPVAMSLAFHELHHRCPNLPCSHLARLSRLPRLSPAHE
jgi:fatty acid desaturase